MAANIDVTFTIAPSVNPMTVNPVIALWDDSGTTRKLWACPKLLLPPLTESTGTWYASCADAATAITDQVSNCMGYIGNPGDWTFSATDGGTSLTLDGGAAVGTPSGFDVWGGINGVAAATISISLSATVGGGAGSAFFTLNLYDDTGTLIATSATSSLSHALPYTGRYTVEAACSIGPPNWIDTASASITGIASVNPIQARYDLGLTCAGTLDCGNACP